MTSMTSTAPQSSRIVALILLAQAALPLTATLTSSNFCVPGRS